MRIRWTTRIATAAGLLTLIAGIATGGGPAHAAARPTAAPAAAHGRPCRQRARPHADRRRTPQRRCIHASLEGEPGRPAVRDTGRRGSDSGSARMSQWDFGYGREPAEHHEPQYPQYPYPEQQEPSTRTRRAEAAWSYDSGQPEIPGSPPTRPGRKRAAGLPVAAGRTPTGTQARARRTTRRARNTTRRPGTRSPTSATRSRDAAPCPPRLRQTGRHRLTRRRLTRRRRRTRHRRTRRRHTRLGRTLTIPATASGVSRARTGGARRRPRPVISAPATVPRCCTRTRPPSPELGRARPGRRTAGRGGRMATEHGTTGRPPGDAG